MSYKGVVDNVNIVERYKKTIDEYLDLYCCYMDAYTLLKDEHFKESAEYILADLPRIVNEMNRTIEIRKKYGYK
jgi:hypothetical protein